MSRLVSRDVDVGCDRSAFVSGVVARNFSAAGKPRQPKFAYPRQRTIRAAGLFLSSDIYLANYGAGSRGSSPLVAACRRTGLCARMSVRICVRCVRMRTRRTHDTVGSNTSLSLRQLVGVPRLALLFPRLLLVLLV